MLCEGAHSGLRGVSFNWPMKLTVACGARSLSTSR